MKYSIEIEIDSPDGTAPCRLREDIVGVVEDYIESKRPPYAIHVNALKAKQGVIPAQLLDALRQLRGGMPAVGSDGVCNYCGREYDDVRGTACPSDACPSFLADKILNLKGVHK